MAKAKKTAKKVSKKPIKKPVKKTSKKAAPKTAKMATPKKAPEKKPLYIVPKKPVLVMPKNAATLQYTQSELFDALTGYCGFRSRREAKEFYAQFTGMIQSALKNGFKLMLPGLGKIQVRKTKPRMGINPKTREPIKIPAKRKVAFTATKSLKESVL